MLEDVNNFVQKTESIAEKINLDLFEDFFESSSLPNCEKTLININNPDENIRICGRDRRQNIKFKRQNKKKWVKQKKNNKNAHETLKIIEEILDYNKNAQK